MAFNFFSFIVAALSISTAFSFRVVNKRASNTAVFSKDQTVKDLNLEEMFEVFEKADKTVTIPKSKAVDYVNGEKSKAVPFLLAPLNLKGLPGYKSFDPFGFSDYLDVKWLQEAEIKHSRIAMLATLGYVATEFVKLPGDVHNITPLAAHDAAVASGSGFQVLTLIAALEFIACVAMKQMYDGSGRIPGDFGFDPLGFSKGKTPEQLAKLQAQELENGRTAMLAFAGIITQTVATGKGFPYF